MPIQHHLACSNSRSSQANAVSVWDLRQLTTNFCLVCTFCFCLWSATLYGPEAGRLSSAEQIYYQIDQDIFVVPDVHGDIDALVETLKLYDLIDDQGNWKKKNASLVFLGDLVDRGSDSLAVLLYVMDLQKQIETSGGQSFALLGNHDLFALSGRFDDITDQDAKAYDALITDPQKLAEFIDSYNDMPPSKAAIPFVLSFVEPFKSWFPTRKAMLVINDNLFLHAAPTTRLVNFHQKQSINRAVQNWVRYFQSADTSTPAKSTEWLLENSGPLASKRFYHEDLKHYADIPEIYNALGVSRGFYGHIINGTAGVLPFLDHKIYLVDAGMERSLGGQLTLAKISRKGEVSWQNGKRPRVASLTAQSVINRLHCSVVGALTLP